MIQIQNEEPSINHKTFLPYCIGLGTIYLEELIQKQKQSPSFEQEYNLKYLSGIGNLFNVIGVDKCILEYSLDDSINTSQSFTRYLGVDPDWGLDSTFAMVVVQWMNGRMYVIHQEVHKNPLYRDMLRNSFSIIRFKR